MESAVSGGFDLVEGKTRGEAKNCMRQIDYTVKQKNSQAVSDGEAFAARFALISAAERSV